MHVALYALPVAHNLEMQISAHPAFKSYQCSNLHPPPNERYCTACMDLIRLHVHAAEIVELKEHLDSALAEVYKVSLL